MLAGYVERLPFFAFRFESPSSGEAVFLEPVVAEHLFCNMVGQGPLMKNVFQIASKVSREQSGVAIEGAAGVGKECVARAIHRLAWKGRGKILSIRRNTLSDNGLDSQSIERTCRDFHEVSLFIERAEDLSGGEQERLLEVLEKIAVGDPLLMISSRCSLNEKIESGEFDKKLGQYFVERIRIPSLCERREDLPLLLAHFFGKYSDENLRYPMVAKSVLNRLHSYSWPGNVMELESLVEQWAALKCSEMITSGDLPEKFYQEINGIYLTEEGIDLKGFLSEIEDSLILQALRMTGDNKNRASKLLRMNRTTLIEKMKKKGLLKSN